MKKKIVKQKKYIEIAESYDWDDLASAIIDIEINLAKKRPKQLKTLEKQLEIYEEEKAKRVMESFDMDYFMYRELEEFLDI